MDLPLVEIKMKMAEISKSVLLRGGAYYTKVRSYGSWQELVGIVGPMLLGLALGVLGVWAWTVRHRRPRLAKGLGWGLAVYLVLGAIGWAMFLTAMNATP